VTLMLIGLISTIVLTNNNFLIKYQADQPQAYQLFVEYLSEESALTKKNIAWFIGNQTQYIASFSGSEWQVQTLESGDLPSIKSSTQFQDNRGKIFSISDSREDPFLVFYPSGQSSGGEISFDEAGNDLMLKIDQYSSIEILTQK